MRAKVACFSQESLPVLCRQDSSLALFPRHRTTDHMFRSKAPPLEGQDTQHRSSSHVQAKKERRRPGRSMGRREHRKLSTTKHGRRPEQGYPRPGLRWICCPAWDLRCRCVEVERSQHLWLLVERRPRAWESFSSRAANLSQPTAYLAPDAGRRAGRRERKAGADQGTAGGTGDRRGKTAAWRAVCQGDGERQRGQLSKRHSGLDRCHDQGVPRSGGEHPDRIES